MFQLQPIEIKNKKWIQFFIFVFILRFLFSFYIPLIDDEAYHWTWTRHLSLSYFDHPGMIAWLEWLSTAILGDTYFGVRLPAFLCYTFAFYFLWRLTYEFFQNENAAHAVGVLFLFTPFWGFGGFVAAPEPPYLLSWILATYVFWQGVREDQYQWSLKKTWITLGFIMGFGINSKFIIVLLAIGFLLFLLITPRHRRDLITPWPWVGFIIASILSAPIFIWNIQNDWPTFKFQFHDRHADTSGFDPARWLTFWGAQFVFLTPFLYLFVMFTWGYAATQIKKTPWRILFCFCLPSFFIFYPQPLWADYKPHWSGTAYTLLIMGSCYLWVQGIQIKNRTLLKPYSRLLASSVLVFFVPINLFLYSPFLGPVLPTVYNWFETDKAWNPQWDLSNEFYGWEELGLHVNKRQLEILAKTGELPFLAAHRYETTAQTYWGTRQRVYMLSKTRSHYTVMQSEAEMQNLVGKNALFVVSEKYPIDPMRFAQFDSCQAEILKTYRGRQHSRTFTIYECKNFQKILR